MGGGLLPFWGTVSLSERQRDIIPLKSPGGTSFFLFPEAEVTTIINKRKILWPVK